MSETSIWPTGSVSPVASHAFAICACMVVSHMSMAFPKQSTLSENSCRNCAARHRRGRRSRSPRSPETLLRQPHRAPPHTSAGAGTPAPPCARVCAPRAAAVRGCSSHRHAGWKVDKAGCARVDGNGLWPKLRLSIRAGIIIDFGKFAAKMSTRSRCPGCRTKSVGLKPMSSPVGWPGTTGCRSASEM